MLTEEALATFGSCSTQERQQLIRSFQQLAEFPDAADFTWSIAGFDYHSKRFGHWSVTYRIDSPVRQIIIGDIEKLRRRA